MFIAILKVLELTMFATLPFINQVKKHHLNILLQKMIDYKTQQLFPFSEPSQTHPKG
jgi:hypothetical protein